MNRLGLVDTLGALIVPNMVSAMGIFLLRQFFVSLPAELEEAARIDGCSRLGVVIKIVLPLARPALTTLAVLTFLTTWNDLTWPLIALTSEHAYTLQLGLTTFQSQHRVQWSAVMAGNVLTVLPVLVAFLSAQRTFVESLRAGAVKG
jgi:multiple sugar transport system permease protein